MSKKTLAAAAGIFLMQLAIVSLFAMGVHRVVEVYFPELLAQ